MKSVFIKIYSAQFLFRPHLALQFTRHFFTCHRQLLAGWNEEPSNGEDTAAGNSSHPLATRTKAGVVDVSWDRTKDEIASKLFIYLGTTYFHAFVGKRWRARVEAMVLPNATIQRRDRPVRCTFKHSLGRMVVGGRKYQQWSNSEWRWKTNLLFISPE